jgi:hypothetical protein
VVVVVVVIVVSKNMSGDRERWMYKIRGMGIGKCVRMCDVGGRANSSHFILQLHSPSHFFSHSLYT